MAAREQRARAVHPPRDPELRASRLLHRHQCGQRRAADGAGGTGTVQLMPGPADVLRYPLFSALRERRSRRIARGVSVDAGALSHVSTNAPAPLSPLEEAMLVVATGITGVATMDGPLDIPGGGKELGTPYFHFAARTARSPDNSQPTQFFMTNDEGIF